MHGTKGVQADKIWDGQMEVQEELEIHVQNAFSKREECKDEPGNATIRSQITDYNCKRQTDRSCKSSS